MFLYWVLGVEKRMAASHSTTRRPAFSLYFYVVFADVLKVHSIQYVNFFFSFPFDVSFVCYRVLKSFSAARASQPWLCFLPLFLFDSALFLLNMTIWLVKRVNNAFSFGFVSFYGVGSTEEVSWRGGIETWTASVDDARWRVSLYCRYRYTHRESKLTEMFDILRNPAECYL